MVVQTPPSFVRKATASGVALARSANTSTSVLPVTPAMVLPPQLTGGWPVPPSRSSSELQSLQTDPPRMSYVDYGRIGAAMAPEAPLKAPGRKLSAIRSAAGGWLARR